MDRPSAGWRATAIPCPSCYARLVRPDRWSTSRSLARYHCLRCGSDWDLTSREPIREQRIVLLAGLSIVFLMALASAPFAAAESICLKVIIDGPLICADAPTYAESLNSATRGWLSLLAGGCAIFFIPLLVGIAVPCRIWCVIVAVAIFVGMVAGSIVGPLVVQYRYPGLYWSNPDLLGDAIGGSIGLITLSLPMSTLVPRFFFGQSRAEKPTR